MSSVHLGARSPKVVNVATPYVPIPLQVSKVDVSGEAGLVLEQRDVNAFIGGFKKLAAKK